MKIYSLYEGSYSVDISKKFIPFNPEIDKAAERKASIFVNVSPFLIETSNELILLDTGLGYTNEAGELEIHKNIRAKGYGFDEVTMVVMSHLHFDHAGGLMIKNGENYFPAFPNATYHIQKDEIESALSRNSASYNQPALHALYKLSQLSLIQGKGKINDNLHYEISGGHSEFHQVITINEKDSSCFFGGDVLPEASQLIRNFVAKYDLDGRKSMELRKIYGLHASENNQVCLFYHDHKTAISRVKESNNGFVITPLKDSVI